MPKLDAATFAETRISSPQVLWAPGYLTPTLSLKCAKVVSTTWRTDLNQCRVARGAALGSGQTWAPYACAQCSSQSSPLKPPSLRRGLCDAAPPLGTAAIHSSGGV